MAGLLGAIGGRSPVRGNAHGAFRTACGHHQVCIEHLTLVSVVELVRVFRIFASDEVKLVVSRRDDRGRMHVTAT